MSWGGRSNPSGLPKRFSGRASLFANGPESPRSRRMRGVLGSGPVKTQGEGTVVRPSGQELVGYDCLLLGTQLVLLLCECLPLG